MRESQLLRSWAALKRKKLLILLIAVLGVAVSWYYSNFLAKPVYEAQTSVLINQTHTAGGSSIQYDTILANEALVNTYTEIILSDTLASLVTQNLGLHFPTSQLQKMIQVTNPGSSQIIDIQVLASSQGLAAEIANEVAKDFQTQVALLMSLENVQIVDPAQVSPQAQPVKPNKELNIAAGLLGGLTLGVMLAMFLEVIDKHIRFADDVELEFHLPLIGMIPDHSRTLNGLRPKYRKKKQKKTSKATATPNGIET